MVDGASSPVVVIRGRVVPSSAYRPSTFVDVGDTVEWWTALAILGASLGSAGALAGLRWGDALAIGGVVLFLLTAVLAGAERIEIATASGVAAMVWTATGISLALGADPSPAGTLFGFVIVGGISLAAGVLGGRRARARDRADP